jgi:hypothetical protein
MNIRPPERRCGAGHVSWTQLAFVHLKIVENGPMSVSNCYDVWQVNNVDLRGSQMKEQVALIMTMRVYYHWLA